MTAGDELEDIGGDVREEGCVPLWMERSEEVNNEVLVHQEAKRGLIPVI